MNHRIIVQLSQGAQQAAARAGEPSERVQSFELDRQFISLALDAGATVEDDGSVVLRFGVDRAGRPDDRIGAPQLASRPTTATNALALIGDWRRAEEERQRAKIQRREEALVQFVAAVAAGDEVAATAARPDYAERQSYTSEQERRYAATDAALDRLRARARGLRTLAALRTQPDGYVSLSGQEREALLPSEREEWDRLDEERTARREAAKDAEAEGKQRRLTRLVALAAEYGDVNLRERLVAGRSPDNADPLGYVSEEEALQIVTDAHLPVDGLAATWGLAEYAPLGAADVCCGDDGDDGNEYCRCSYLQHEADLVIDAATWRRVQATRAALKRAGLPGGTIRRHVGACATHSESAERWGIYVQLDLGGLVVDREYALVEAKE